MKDLHDEARELFGAYLEAWNARDFPRVASCFAAPAMFILPRQTVLLPDARAVIALLGKVFEGLEAAGFSHTEIGEVVARDAGGGLAIIEAKGVRRLKADGSLLENIDGHYVARRGDDGLRFEVAVACKSGWQAGAG